MQCQSHKPLTNRDPDVPRDVAHVSLSRALAGVVSRRSGTASLPYERRRESRPAGSQGIFRTASIRSAAPGWVAKNPPLPGPETCWSQVKVSIIISFG